MESNGKIEYLQKLKSGGVVSGKSGIHIKKENRGKFTDYCGGKVTSECIARGKNSPNPTIRKRATFAANARKWKHQQGGLIYSPFSLQTQEEENNNLVDFSDYFDQGPSNLVEFPVEPVQTEWPIYWNHSAWTGKREKEEEKPRGNGRVYKAGEQKEFVQTMHQAYKDAYLQRGFDEKEADEYAWKLTAKAALESAYGTSGLSRDYNFGGVKDFRKDSDSIVADTTEVINGQTQRVKQPFRRFKSLEEYINYDIDLMGNDNYNVYAYGPSMLFRRLKEAPKQYATATNYVDTLRKVENYIRKHFS